MYKTFTNKSKLEDSIIILLNCSACYSIIPYILFHQYSRGIFIILIGIINICFLSFRFKEKTELPNNKLFLIYVILNIWNAYAGLFSDTGYITSIAYLLSNSSFFLILYNLYLSYRQKYTQKQTIWYIVRGYVWLIVCCVISVFCVFLTIKLGLNPYTHNVSNKYDLFGDNVASFGAEYYAPYYMGILLKTTGVSVRVPFFSDEGIICGIYHEPHVLTFMVFPCMFFMWAFTKNNIQKFGIVISSIFIALVAGSTTNLLVAIVCLIIALIFSKKGKLLLIPLLGILLLFILIIGLENTELFFVMEKLEDSGGSKGYTMDALDFAFNPKTLVGSNILNTSFIKEIGSARRDAGIISVILNVIFLIICYFKVTRLLFSNRFNCLIGVGVIYFLLHSIKINLTTYTSSILMLSIFLISYTIYTPNLRNIVDQYGKNQEDFKK